jgi:CMP-N-acetylneuraminic acid synthetase
METVGFIPCRAGSERVLNKNTRPFAGVQGGLLELKLRQFQKVEGLDRIIVSSNDAAVLDFAANFASQEDSRVEPLPRPDEWGNSATSMGAFIRDYIANLCEDGHLFWSHVTHPFATSSLYQRALAEYHQKLEEGYDCLISATRIQKFLWRDGKPFNYDNTIERWPRSQDLTPVFEINHAIYAIPFKVMRDTGDRVGHRPHFFEMEESESMDIDWQDQFNLLGEIAQARLARGQSLL